ncbi:MAG: hypothetical protein JST17_12870 [Bacteroidetes bacterium]|nr:hypothetical protein [Bacteroidota bacterium]MBS1930538.1 hypothetical protein [Bacteroidota bacterium]
MNTLLLDVAIGATNSVLWILLLVLLLVILIEAVIISLFRINNFGKAFLNSSIVNVVSTVIGYLLNTRLDFFSEKISSTEQWLILFGITVVIEGLMMMVLNSKVSKGKLWLVTVIMNLVSYIFLYVLSII